jgi:hypothetical protein
MATRIENAFIREHFYTDHVESLPGGWQAIQDAVLRARRILAEPDVYPHADFDYLEKLDLEGTSCLLGAPVQFIV